jgi:hypothetical protein
MSRPRLIYLLPVAAALIGLAAPAHAQAPAVSYVYPAGVKTGGSGTVAVNGGNLNGATSVMIEGQGVTATIKDAANAGAITLQLDVAANATPGMREVRVVTPRGVSNAGRLWLTAYPGVNEVEPNNTPPMPQKLAAVPVTLDGQVNGATDIDIFSFEAGAGDTFVFDLAAYRMVSGLDGYLILANAKGKTLQTAQEGFDRDPRIVYTFPAAGTYQIAVRDSMFRGGGNFTYRLTMGKIPVITGYLPVGGKKGQSVNLTLEGANLGAMKNATVQMPGDLSDVTVAPNAPTGAPSSPITLVTGDTDEATETEPNDEPAQATQVGGAPITLNGRIDKTGERDLYRFTPAAAGTLAFEVQAKRIGSRIDSNLRILDAMGKAISENDDALGKDSRIVMNVAAGTTYLIEVRSVDQRFGGDCFYRVEITPPGGQDFSLRTTPDSVNVGLGGSTLVTVNVTRQNGFAGPIDLRVEGLPAGMTASRALIPPGQATGQFTITAAANAAAGAMGAIKVIGKGMINGNPVEHVATPFENYVAPLATPDQAKPKDTVYNSAATMPAQAYALDITPKEITVKRGMPVTITVNATRQAGQTAQINLAVAGQPGNVTPALQNIAANANSATITLNVAANAPVVTQNVIITGNMNNNVQTAPAFTLTITE